MRRRVPLTFLALFIAAACGGSDATATSPNPNSESIVGTWHLQTLNGSPLPFVVQSGATKSTTVSESITIADNGTWSGQLLITVSVNGGPATPQITELTGAGGTWSRVGPAVYFSVSDGLYEIDRFHAELSGNTMTIGRGPAYNGNTITIASGDVYSR